MFTLRLQLQVRKIFDLQTLTCFRFSSKIAMWGVSIFISAKEYSYTHVNAIYICSVIINISLSEIPAIYFNYLSLSLPPTPTSTIPTEKCCLRCPHELDRTSEFATLKIASHLLARAHCKQTFFANWSWPGCSLTGFSTQDSLRTHVRQLSWFPKDFFVTSRLYVLHCN